MQELPWSGQISLADFLGSLGHITEVLDSAAAIHHRVVAYQDGREHWTVYASGLYVALPDSHELSTVDTLGPLTLVSHRGSPSDVDDPDKFRDFVHSWPKLVGGGPLERKGFNEPLLVERYPSDQGPQGYPCWRTSIYYATSTPDPPPPRGPFFDSATKRFAETAADASVNWLQDEVYRQGSTPSSALRVVVVDPRARITAIRRGGDTVDVVVHGSRPDMQLDMVIQAVGYRGYREPAISVPVKSTDGVRAGTISLDRPIQQFRALLFGPDGQVYDEINESVSHPSVRAYELFGIGATQEDSDLTYVLDTGESEASECKDWMPTDVSDGKAMELLQTVCAFANGNGGSIYIGVTDDLEVKGTDRNLKVWRPRDKRPGQRIEDLRSEYTKALRARIAEGISPSVPVEIEWISHAGGEYVCRVKVIGSGRIIHYVIATNDVYVRRGASSRKARPDELSSPPSNSGILRELGFDA
jgi:hypothetical protein